MTNSFYFRAMNRAEARQASTWVYPLIPLLPKFPAKLSWYRQQSYVSMLQKRDAQQSQLVGFYCVGKPAQVSTVRYSSCSYAVQDFGFARHPSQYARSTGKQFLISVMKDIANEHPDTNLRATVQASNDRARSVLRQCGFEVIDRQTIKSSESLTYLVFEATPSTLSMTLANKGCLKNTAVKS